MPVRLVQPSKAQSPMLMTPLPMVTLVRLLHQARGRRGCRLFGHWLKEVILAPEILGAVMPSTRELAGCVAGCGARQSGCVSARAPFRARPHLFPGEQFVEDRADMLGCQNVAFCGEMDAIRRNHLVDQAGILPEFSLEDAVEVAEQDFLAVGQCAHLLAEFPVHVFVETSQSLKLFAFTPAVSVVVEGRAGHQDDLNVSGFQYLDDFSKTLLKLVGFASAGVVEAKGDGDDIGMMCQHILFKSIQCAGCIIATFPGIDYGGPLNGRLGQLIKLFLNKRRHSTVGCRITKHDHHR